MTAAKTELTVHWQWMMQYLMAQTRVPTPANTWMLFTCVYQVRVYHCIHYVSRGTKSSVCS